MLLGFMLKGFMVLRFRVENVMTASGRLYSLNSLCNTIAHRSTFGDFQAFKAALGVDNCMGYSMYTEALHIASTGVRKPTCHNHLKTRSSTKIIGSATHPKGRAPVQS